MKVFLLLSFLINLPLCFAKYRGGMEGGGGKGVLCGNKLRVLEVYEAEEIYQLPAVRKYQSIQENMIHYGLPLGLYWSESEEDANTPQYQSEFMDLFYVDTISRFQDIPNGERLSPTMDATVPPLPADCKLVQIALYLDEEQIIKRDLEYWNMLSAFDQAALLLHEAYYKAYRQFQVKTSDEVRRVVGLAMFNKLPEPLFKPIWNQEKVIQCVSTDFPGNFHSFYGVETMKDGKIGVTLYPQFLSTQIISFRYELFFDGWTLDDFLVPHTFHKLFVLENDYMPFKKYVEISKVKEDENYLIKMRSWRQGQDPNVEYSDGICHSDVN